MKDNYLEQLKDRQKKATSKYNILKNHILDGVSKDIKNDYTEMSEALWEMERINSVLMEQEYADRRLIEEIHIDVINTDPSNGENDVELVKG